MKKWRNKNEKAGKLLEKTEKENGREGKEMKKRER